MSGPFLLDLMLGKLAVYLRLCGYDTVYAGDVGIEDDDRIRRVAVEDERTLLTRDAELAARTPGAILIDAHEVDAQLAELRRAGIELSLGEPSRCGRCNGRLEPVDPGERTPTYAPNPDETDCWRCRACGQYFWNGSHVDRMASVL